MKAISKLKTVLRVVREGGIPALMKVMVYKLRVLRGPRLSVSSHVWSKAQDGELRYHLENAAQLATGFEQNNAVMLKGFGFGMADYVGKNVVDIGAGSRLRTRFFEGAHVFVIEPLAERYMNDVSGCDLCVADRVYAVPAEEVVPELINIADLVISINALDHCREFGQVIRNIALYAKSSALIFLSFDGHEIANEMHPLVLNKNVCERAFRTAGLLVVRYQEKEEYGSGVALNWWLKKDSP
jgi:hypothetical protein